MNAFQTTLLIVAAVLIIYHFILRPVILRRGVTKNEARRKFPGDELISPKRFRSTMAANINATPEEIWPWLVQVGWGRAAFYSYNVIESLFRMDLQNADHVHPEWQDIHVGDTFWMSHPRQKDLFPLARVENAHPPNELSFSLYWPSDADTKPSGVWSFILEPIDENTTRLISRHQVTAHSIRERLRVYFFMEPAHFVMQEGMFKGIKKRIAAPKLKHADQLQV